MLSMACLELRLAPLPLELLGAPYLELAMAPSKRITPLLMDPPVLAPVPVPVEGASVST